MPEVAPLCPVCGHATDPFLTKDFKGDTGLGLVEYVRCTDCGFVYAPTIYRMGPEEFAALNARFHAYLDGEGSPPWDPAWETRMAAQRALLLDLAPELPGRWLDYACGDGRLTAGLGLDVVGYDPYRSTAAIPLVGDDELAAPGAFSCVLSTAFFEHVRDIGVIKSMASLVAPDGAFVIHTEVVTVVPRRYNWFYFLPTHCSVFTKNAFAHLAADCGFARTEYHPAADMHVWWRS